MKLVRDLVQCYCVVIVVFHLLGLLPDCWWVIFLFNGTVGTALKAGNESKRRSLT